MAKTYVDTMTVYISLKKHRCLAVANKFRIKPVAASGIVEVIQK